MIDKPLVSIIVPCYNSEKTIETFINSILAQTYNYIEIIAINDASNDRTLELLKEFAGRFNIKIVNNTRNLGMTASRNVGIKHFTGDYVWFLDSDMELLPDVVEKCVHTCEFYGYDALMIPERSKGSGMWAKCRGFEKRINDSDIYKNACRFMKKEVINKVGIYDQELVAAEDYDYHTRVKEVGFKFTLIKNAYIYHYEVSSVFRMVKKAYNYGKTMMKYVRKRPVDATKQFFIVRPAYVKNYKMFLKEPILGLGLILIKIIQYSAAILGMCVYFFEKVFSKKHESVIN